MKKSTVAAIAAASLLGFGAVGNAMAAMEISGFGDINYDALHTESDEGTFRASGEVDLIQKADGGVFRADFDLNNCHNSSPAADLPSGTNPGCTNGGGTGADIEQLNVAIPVQDMATVTAGIWNSPFGLEGQDATDYNFAANGLLWQSVPSNVAGALVSVAPTDMVSVNLGYINKRTNIVGGSAGGDTANDILATVSVMAMDGLTVNLGYLTDESETFGDQFDINATLSDLMGVLPGLDITLDYMAGDPSSTSGSSFLLDNGFGVHVAYAIGAITAAIRYEDASYGPTSQTDQTWTSLSVGYGLSDDCVVRADWTNMDMDTLGTSDTATIQLVHSFGDDGMM